MINILTIVKEKQIKSIAFNEQVFSFQNISSIPLSQDG